ncbi:hypothetical protein RDV64_23645 (plasmid) [Acuticoccus sp. MNP-M23]|uniref:hypothetical protein n=1 Tax=Acuticoccus sp. MNP-M23 TaxID=3072793 RepID=UPI002815627E|nr:hypothetical protein [Acuticoccus sp. MNP-M23]WMS45350.1 hypothetical protein RDV64_23645 [Acuticoccus sp. MNP-M23]
MHKTGSSSIQATMAKMATKDPLYVLPNPANNSVPLAAIFEENPRGLFKHRSKRQDPEYTSKIIEQWKNSIDETLSSCNARSVVFSAEYLSVASHEAIERMRDYLSRYCSSIQIIGYVRPPVPWINSAFQQRSKNRAVNNFQELITLRDYRKVFEKFDKIFGVENVSLVVFDRKTLKGNDVVLDFAHRIGFPLNHEDVVQANESMSLEAVSLLYAKRFFGSPMNWENPNSAKAYARFLDKLRGLGKRKVSLAESLVAPLLADHQDDIDWMEQRVGASLRGETDFAADAIGGEEDLIAVALSSARLLDEIEPGLAPRDPTLESVTAALDKLYGICLAQVGGATRDDTIVTSFARALEQTYGATSPNHTEGRGASYVDLSRSIMNDLRKQGFVVRAKQMSTD